MSVAAGRGTHLNGPNWRMTWSRKALKYLGTSGLFGVTSLHWAQASVGEFGVGEPVRPHTRRVDCLLQMVLRVFQRRVDWLRAKASSSTTIKSMSSRLASSSAMMSTPSMLMT